MPQLIQYRTVAMLAAISALATLFYLSEWTRVDPNAMNRRPQYQQPQDHQGSPIVTIPRPEEQRQQQQQQEQKPPKTNKPTTTPAIGQAGKPATPLVSDKNARIAAMNSQAFVNFCNSIPPPPPANPVTTTPIANSLSVPTFSSYKEWIDFIKNKNSIQHNDIQTDDEDNSNSKADLEFLERPLRNWIINLTAIAEPCDRHIHTSAHCLEFLTREHQYLVPSRQTPPPAPSDQLTPMHFHIFWRGLITDKLSLSSFSFLFTQPLDRAHLHLWIDSADLPDGAPEDYTQNKFAAALVQPPLNQFITIHAWDQAEELAYSYREGPSVNAANDDDNGTNDSQEQKLKEPEQEKGTTGHQQPVKPVALSDEARFLILNRNGGIYLDADVLLLKDMSPFFDSGVEFAYEWSNTGMYNTAILRLFPGSSVARRILDGAKARELEPIQAKLKEQRARQDEQEEENDGEYDEDHEEGEETDGGEKMKKAAGLVAGNKTVANRRRGQLMVKREMRPEEIYHPARLRAYLRPEDSKLEGNGLIQMPTPVFDPLWLRVDHAEAKKSNDPERMIEDLHTFPDAFSAQANAVCPRQAQVQAALAVPNDDEKVEFSAGPEVFLSGAYAHHWHNNWLTPIEAKSWMGLMRAAFDDFVEGRRPNLYGEWFQDSIDM
ncbi:hypothetical protein BGZ96_011806 [Linnemannia gamsii]|uniref:Glycosyltransferase family 32 protein n=1 Tax=Linnemannia gamsii TaxID=64522 RepID=A0ABQ7JSJ9_9FUNG|nr:hypothetical protein BGZ96_011806 [Linnemannia gamsii]